MILISPSSRQIQIFFPTIYTFSPATSMFPWIPCSLFMLFLILSLKFIAHCLAIVWLDLKWMRDALKNFWQFCMEFLERGNRGVHRQFKLTWKIRGGEKRDLLKTWMRRGENNNWIFVWFNIWKKNLRNHFRSTKLHYYKIKFFFFFFRYRYILVSFLEFRGLKRNTRLYICYRKSGNAKITLSQVDNKLR